MASGEALKDAASGAAAASGEAAASGKLRSKGKCVGGGTLHGISNKIGNLQRRIDSGKSVAKKSLAKDQAALTSLLADREKIWEANKRTFWYVLVRLGTFW